MQPTPLRLSQALWTAFKASKPTHQRPINQCLRLPRTRPQCALSPSQTWKSQLSLYARHYSDDKRAREVDRKVEDAKDRINESLEARAEEKAQPDTKLKAAHDETIIHTLPESSSIVYTKDAPYESDQNTKADSSARPKSDPNSRARRPDPSSALPSQIAHFRSELTKRFSYFMDNFQSNIFVASRHINDLTGYSSIERLKREIEAQEAHVQDTRELVKASRAKYTAAIETRSTTQREVNDLLHRKHAWSPTDLERFTHLYRSDHANEQDESKTQQDLANAEAQYEEASTKLARSILARYHEEQIWSDKIRQMSTWGTWSLMGLNVLLFVIFQIAIEPWRRRRLVKGFEEKVQEALGAQDLELKERSRLRDADLVVQDAVEMKNDGVVVSAVEQVAETVVDAVTGATEGTSSDTQIASIERKEIEEAAEQVTSQELKDEAKNASLATTTAEIAESVPEGGTPDIVALEMDSAEPSPNTSIPVEEATSPATSTEQQPIPLPTTTPWTNTPSQLLASISSSISHYQKLIEYQFTTTDHIVLNRRELSVRVLEGVAAGAAATVAIGCGVFFVFVRGR